MVALIIFGTTGIRSTIKEGNFLCPQCLAERRYKHKKVTQFFTLYFIPLIPLGNKGEYVECQTCRNTYIERVLHLSESIREAQSNQVVEDAPAQEIQQPAAAIGMVGSSDTATNRPSNAVILSEKQKAVKKLLIMMILADGKVENSEIHMFHKVYREVANGVVADIYSEIEKVKTENKLPHQYLKEVSPYLNSEGKVDIIKASMMIAAADDDIDPSEIRMVENFGKALDMKPAEVKTIIESFLVKA